MVGSEKGPSVEGVVLRVGPVESAANGFTDVCLNGTATGIWVDVVGDHFQRFFSEEVSKLGNGSQ